MMDNNPIAWVALTLIVLAVYFLPTIIAFRRKEGHPYRWYIFACNLFLGATLLGWIVALGAAVMNLDPSVEGDFTDQAFHGLLGKGDRIKKCPFCAETIKEEARVCRFCSRDLLPQTTEQPL